VQLGNEGGGRRRNAPGVIHPGLDFGGWKSKSGGVSAQAADDAPCVADVFGSQPLPRPKRQPYPWEAGAPIDFFMPFDPPTATAQHKGARVHKGEVFFYTKAELREIEEMLRAQMAPFVVAAPLDGPLSLLMEWFFPWRKTEPAKNRVTGRKWHTSKPDCSNIIKAPEDQLTRLRFWHDDGQIADLRVIKRWADTPGIRVVITQLSEE